MPQLWVRRCSKCLTIDLREVWENPADAHTLPVVPRWARPFYGSRFRWTCPTCGRAVEPGGAHAAAAEPVDDEDELGPIPWHLKLLAAALAVYLGWRAWQGIEWLAHAL